MEEEMQCLPNLYRMPKMYKTPVGERFIIASPNCSTTPLLKDATKIVSLCQHNIENFHKKIEYGLESETFGLSRTTVLLLTESRK